MDFTERARVFLFILFTICLRISNAAHILAVFPVPTISHHIVYRSIIEQLALNGHYITLITPNPIGFLGELQSNIREVDVSGVTYTVFEKNHINYAKEYKQAFSLLPKQNDIWLELLEAQLAAPEVSAVLKNSNVKFDLLITETYVPTTYVLADKFHIPLVLVSTHKPLVNTFEAVGNPTHPILYPDFYSKLSGKMNVFQKIGELYRYLSYKSYYFGTYVPHCQKVANKYFGSNLRSVEDMEMEIDLLLVGGNQIVHGIRPTVPALVYADELHITGPRELPPDFKHFLDASTAGVIYFSLGTTVLSQDLSQEKLKVFLDTFAKLPFKVLWKYENETLPGKPDNVIISSWFPQQELLAHPNVKAFITAGGLQSIEEAIYYMVPIVGIPFFGDQVLNVRKVVEFGGGVDISPDELTVETLSQAIAEIFGKHNKYSQDMEEFSSLLSDQPSSGMDRAMWWIEYVIRHNGTQHLRAPAIGVTYWEYFMLDVISYVSSIALACVLVACFVLKQIFKFIFRFIKQKKEHKKFKEL